VPNARTHRSQKNDEFISIRLQLDGFATLRCPVILSRSLLQVSPGVHVEALLLLVDKRALLFKLNESVHICDREPPNIIFRIFMYCFYAALVWTRKRSRAVCVCVLCTRWRCGTVMLFMEGFLTNGRKIERFLF